LSTGPGYERLAMNAQQATSRWREALGLPQPWSPHLQRTPPATTFDSSAPWPDISTPGSMTE